MSDGFDEASELYTAGGVVYGAMLSHWADATKHLADPWLLFSGVAQFLCDHRPLKYIDVWSRVPVALCQNCIEETRN